MLQCKFIFFYDFEHLQQCKIVNEWLSNSQVYNYFCKNMFFFEKIIDFGSAFGGQNDSKSLKNGVEEHVSFESRILKIFFRFFLFACCCGPFLGLIFLLCWAMLKIVVFFLCVFYKRLKSRVSLERCRKNGACAFFSFF